MINIDLQLGMLNKEISNWDIFLDEDMCVEDNFGGNYR